MYLVGVLRDASLIAFCCPLLILIGYTGLYGLVGEAHGPLPCIALYRERERSELTWSIIVLALLSGIIIISGTGTTVKYTFRYVRPEPVILAVWMGSFV